MESAGQYAVRLEGWMNSVELRRIQLLDWLYDFKGEHDGEMAAIKDFLGDEADDYTRSIMRDVLEDLARDDLIILALGFDFDGASALIKSRGRAEVEGRRTRRANRALRNIACRTAVIRWLYEQPGHQAVSTQAMMTTPEYYFEGAPFESPDLDAALLYLLDIGLLRGTKVMGGSVARPRLTTSGIECAERFGGSVADYQDRQRGGTINNVQFTGPISGGNFAIGSQDVTQQTKVGVGSEELLTLIRAMREALPALDLRDDARVQLSQDLELAEGEVLAPDGQPPIVRELLGRAATKLTDAGAGALNAVLQAVLKYEMAKHGMPLL
jgi:hypothetical protein